MKYSFMQDFDYNNIKISDLGQLKMPYINFNRRVFVNSGKDLIDILLLYKNLWATFSKTINILKSKIEMVRCSIAIMLEIEEDWVFELSEKKNYTSENLLGVEINSETKKQLNNEFVKINTAIRHVGKFSINKMIIQLLLRSIDRYIFEDVKFDLFLSCFKPSIIFFNILDNEFLDVDEAIRFLIRIIDVYEEFWDSIEFINSTISKLVKHNFPIDIFTPCVLIYNIFIKWYVESRINAIVSNIESLDDINSIFPVQIVIYSNNADSIFEKLFQVIKLIADETSEKDLHELNIQKIKVKSKLFNASSFDSYEIEILNKKYLIKKFSWADTPSLPTGLSTTYLNVQGKFTSIGYLAFGNMNDEFKGFLFLSVEENIDDSFVSDNFSIFKNEEYQVLWFILDFLYILDKMVSYKIMIVSTALLFAIKKDVKRWRFRIDDIGNFEYVTNESPYANHELLINMLRSICSTIKKQTICDYIKHLMKYADNLKNIGHPYCIEMLISNIEQKLSTI